MPTLGEKLNPSQAVLLVVDVQNDYAHQDGALARAGMDVSSTSGMLSRLRRLIETARQAAVPIVFTRNWHTPATDTGPWLDRVLAGGATAETRPGRAGTWGAEFFGVAPDDDDIVISKTRYDAFLGTGLDEVLRSRGVETVVVAGITTNVCVESTARSAHMRDFHLVLVGDCCASPEPELHAATLLTIARHFGDVVDLEGIERRWASAGRPVRAGTN